MQPLIGYIQSGPLRGAKVIVRKQNKQTGALTVCLREARGAYKANDIVIIEASEFAGNKPPLERKALTVPPEADEAPAPEIGYIQTGALAGTRVRVLKRRLDGNIDVEFVEASGGHKSRGRVTLTNAGAYGPNPPYTLTPTRDDAPATIKVGNDHHSFPVFAPGLEPGIRTPAPAAPATDSPATPPQAPPGFEPAANAPQQAAEAPGPGQVHISEGDMAALAAISPAAAAGIREIANLLPADDLKILGAAPAPLADQPCGLDTAGATPPAIATAAQQPYAPTILAKGLQNMAALNAEGIQALAGIDPAAIPHRLDGGPADRKPELITPQTAAHRNRSFKAAGHTRRWVPAPEIKPGECAVPPSSRLK